MAQFFTPLFNHESIESINARVNGAPVRIHSNTQLKSPGEVDKESKTRLLSESTVKIVEKVGEVDMVDLIEENHDNTRKESLVVDVSTALVGSKMEIGGDGEGSSILPGEDIHKSYPGHSPSTSPGRFQLPSPLSLDLNIHFLSHPHDPSRPDNLPLNTTSLDSNSSNSQISAFHHTHKLSQKQPYALNEMPSFFSSSQHSISANKVFSPNTSQTSTYNPQFEHLKDIDKTLKAMKIEPTWQLPSDLAYSILFDTIVLYRHHR